MSQPTRTTTMYREMEGYLCDPTTNLGFVDNDAARVLGDPIIGLGSGHDMVPWALGSPANVPNAASLAMSNHGSLNFSVSNPPLIGGSSGTGDFEQPQIGQPHSGPAFSPAPLPANPDAFLAAQPARPFYPISGAWFSPPIQTDFTAVASVGLGLAADPRPVATPQGQGQGQARSRARRHLNTRPTCECGMHFSRRSSLDRHRQSGACTMQAARDGAGYPCEYCGGTWSAGRRDHLLQHLRVYHKFHETAMEKHRVRQVNNVAAARGQTAGPVVEDANWDIYAWEENDMSLFRAF